jgi:cytochrome b6-f complex iron-sulfur subunit
MARNIEQQTRRGMLARLMMAAGLTAGGGVFAWIAARYVTPLKAIRNRRQIYLASVKDVPAGKGRKFGLPGGATALVTQAKGEIVALSDTCPHLGCKVHFEPDRGQFVCPCHNGIFDSNGIAISGPPAEQGKNLHRYDVKQVGDNIFLEIEETIQV